MGDFPNKETQFSEGNQPDGRGRPKGTRNRATIAKEWLKALEATKNPITGTMESLSQEDIMTLALINKARKGDVSAYKALMDSCYGLAKQTLDNTSSDGTMSPVHLTAKELKAINEKLDAEV